MGAADRPTTALIGAAGEHYVMSQLLRQGFVAALAPQGAPGVDILVTDAAAGVMRAIQVKTRQGAAAIPGWRMAARHETAAAPGLLYCLVDFGVGLAAPVDVFVLPAAVVAEVLATSHRAWLAAPGRGGRRRQDSEVRRLLADHSGDFGADSAYGPGWLEPYRNAWDRIGA
ncbi:hypothetical protein [Rhodobacteraceae bacterium DSL-40]|uniref:hypothetical protein n=1 Tax=Amaricoccus sp. B4 TaxID=3368557 RepID=UPI000DAEF9AF